MTSRSGSSAIVVRGARLHNLKNVTVSIPKNQLVVLTGPSGSGKSTLGFDILNSEGKRQYLESLGLVPYGFAKPPVDAISGLSPSISIDQHLTNRSPRSTLGTVTDVFTYLRVLFARLGHRPCPHCGNELDPTADPSTSSGQARRQTDDGRPQTDDGRPPSSDDDFAEEETFPCPHCGRPVVRLIMAHFSFNKPEGACPTCTGLGTVQQADVDQLIDKDKSLAEGAVLGWDRRLIAYHTPVLQAAARHYGFTFDPSVPFTKYTPAQRDLLLYGVESPRFQRHFPKSQPPKTVRAGRFEGVATSLLRRYAEHIQAHIGEAGYRDKLEDRLVTQTCPDCEGTRLRPESRAVTVAGKTIVDLAGFALTDLEAWLRALPDTLTPDERLIAGDALAALHDAIARLVEVGAGYLTIERGTPTLSAGERQRLRLATLLGSGLSGVLYVFDEPTIGLHHRDTRRLIGVLRRLRGLGNTVLVIEHDLDMIAAADHIVDFGPGGGKHGGQVMAAGTPAEVAATTGSPTGDYLARRASIAVPAQRRVPDWRHALTIHGARLHNLQNIAVRFPLGLLVAVTGVSGSGKSSLVFDILDRALRERKTADGGRRTAEVGDKGRLGKISGSKVQPSFDSLIGEDAIANIITIDQAHIGRIPRSNAVTYSEAFTPIRQAFAATPDAERLGLSARFFSFNVPGGRCERCEGAGVLMVRMQLLPDVEVRCPVCHGRRFTPQTLAVHYRGYDISQVLDMTVDEALPLFAEVPQARSRLQVLSDVGLGYLQLGQPATTLSGGEAQRVKLAKELGRTASPQIPNPKTQDPNRNTPRRNNKRQTLYLLDEPTTGLHLADTARLIGVLQRLVDAGNSVIVVEHNLELVKVADWVIDLGPEGGAAGGQIIAEGTPEQVAQAAGSYTGEGLRELL